MRVILQYHENLVNNKQFKQMFIRGTTKQNES